jgi:hypothetical protein
MEPNEFDLRPDPRILPMLGEINLAQWRCIAELVDNSVDGFLSAFRVNASIATPEVVVNIPMNESASARVTIRDNGPGMAPDVLEKAVRAGWTGNSPIGNLGMFGMGFNIATARLGGVTTVWTATKESGEWHGLKIDFEELMRQRHFRTRHETRPKIDPNEHGTEITIERLKPEQRAWLIKPANQNQLRQHLGTAYASMLRAGGVPIHFALTVNGRRVQAKNHCVWNDTRSVDLPRWGTVPAVITIDQHLPSRMYCVACMQWLAAGEDACPNCQSTSTVVARERHVHGWIGLQRYLSTSEFGLDFIRNGRKIEIANKDLFDWRVDDEVEREYPIDDPRNRGRFVGEIHIDHCRVTYTKDRFDRTDPAWEDMVRIVRGDGPLRPEKATQAGYGSNQSPLFRLFQAFRRSSPQNQKVAGGWQKVLVVRDNERAESMARESFYKGVTEYQDDTKWFELVLEEDLKQLTPPTGPQGGSSSGGTSTGPTSGSPLTGFGTPSPGSPTPQPQPPPAPPPRQSIPSLSREYRHDGTNLRWDVRAFEVRAQDPELRGVLPWQLRKRPTGEDDFFVNVSHPIFRSATLTPLDALLSQLAWSVMDFTRGQATPPAFATVLADLRDRYAGSLKLDPATLKSQVDTLFASIAKVWCRNLDSKDAVALFNGDGDIPPTAREAIYTKMAVRGVSNPHEAIQRGRFLEYATPRIAAKFVLARPELFFDGRCWETSYADLEYPHPIATEEARARVLQHYESLLFDAVWLAEQEVGDLELAQRERIIRAALAVELLQPDADLE